MSYLDNNGLSYFWQKVKAYVASAVASAGNVPSGGTAGQVLAKRSATDNDTEWKTLAASDVGAAASSHSHAISDVTNLQSVLDGKASDLHGHAISDIANLQTTLDGKAASTHYHQYIYAPASSSHLHRAYLTTSDNLRVDNRASTSDSYAIVGYAALGTQAPSGSDYKTANQVFATPDGSDGLPSMRALVADDIPSLAASKIGSGTLGVARGGTGKASHTVNSILSGNASSTTGAVVDIATASGALYATEANGVAKFGTLPVAQGGTGQTSVANARAYLGCKLLFSGTAATSVTINETAANFKCLIVEISLNADANRFATVACRNTIYTDWCAPVLSSSLWYIKGGVVRANGTTVALSDVKNISFSASALNSGMAADSACKITRVWGFR